MSIEMVGLADIVRAHGRQRPDMAAIVYEGRTTSYGALDRAGFAIIAAELREAASSGPVTEDDLDQLEKVFLSLA